MTTPSHDELVARARAMIPVLQERAPRQQEHRRILDETMAELKQAGFFKVIQPKRWGGYEMSPTTFYEVQMALAEGDVSVGWVYGILGVHQFHLGLFDDKAAQDVWGKDDSVLIASPYSPGKAVPVEGGFKFSGKWKFSSGTEHCDWVFLGGVVDGSGGAGGPPDARSFLIPRKDYQIIDTWHVVGLKGTGSQDLVIEECFVPEYRTHKNIDAVMGTNPGRTVNSGPLFRLPFWQVFLRAVSTASIGGLQGMANAFIDYGRKRVSVTGASTARDPDAQLAIAETLSAIDEMKANLYRNFAKMEAYAARGEQTPLEERFLYRYQCTSVPKRCGDLALRLFQCSGGSGIFNSMPFGRIYTDILAMQNHAGNQYQTYGRSWGSSLFGLENMDPLL